MSNITMKQSPVGEYEGRSRRDVWQVMINEVRVVERVKLDGSPCEESQCRTVAMLRSREWQQYGQG